MRHARVLAAKMYLILIAGPLRDSIVTTTIVADYTAILYLHSIAQIGDVRSSTKFEFN